MFGPLRALRGPSRWSLGPGSADHLVFVAASVLVGLSLFFPRPMNFAPIGALGLFSGAYAPGRRAWLYPLGALTVYVVALGGYHWLVLSSVYIGFAVPALVGSFWLRGQVRAGRVGASALATSVLFFLISNMGSWIAFGIARGQGLVHHYILGIPFFWNTLAGDVFFSTVLFGGYALMPTRRRMMEPDHASS